MKTKKACKEKLNHPVGAAAPTAVMYGQNTQDIKM